MELGTFGWRLISVAVFFVVCYIFASRIRRSMARTHVLQKKSDLTEKLEEIKKSASVLKAGNGTHKALAGLEQGFRRFSLLNAFRDADWVAERAAIDVFEKEVKNTVAGMLATKSK